MTPGYHIPSYPCEIVQIIVGWDLNVLKLDDNFKKEKMDHVNLIYIYIHNNNNMYLLTS